MGIVRAVATGLIGAAVLVLGGCSAPSHEGPQEKTGGESVTVEVNALAPAFAGKTLDGGVVRLADYMGSRVVLLEFWSIFCKSCLEEMPHIEDLYRRYQDRGLAVLSVNTDVFSAQRIRRFLKKTGIRPPYPVVLDARQEVAKAYGVEVLPVTVIVDRSGWIRLYQEGYRPGDEDRFERVVRRYLGRRGETDVTLAPRGGMTAFAPVGARLVEVGTRVEPLRGTALEGGEVTIGPGSAHFLFFWSLYCRPCRSEFGSLWDLARRYQERGVRFYSVNVDTPALGHRIRRFLQGRGSPPCLADWEGKGVARALGVRATPTVVVLDREGRVVHASAGKVDLEALEASLKGVATPVR